MKNDLVMLTVIFENCEVLAIPADKVSGLYIDGVTECYYKHPGTNNVCVTKEADKLKFTVCDFNKESQGRLLKYQDITSIVVTCENGVKRFRANWDSEPSCYENSKQFYQYFGNDLDIYIGFNKEEMDCD